MKIFKTKPLAYILMTLFVLSVSFFPRPTHAQGVPVFTGFDYQSVMQYQKSFTLDRIATMIAKQILHAMTASVVNWINSGFEGSPLFLTNPEAFFLDVGDQITGAFLAKNGPLSSLCSPFAIDLRLSLALSQTSLSNQRYTCTLKQIIAAQKNGPDITVNGKVLNSSVNGFMGGDFEQGGWPAFITLTTEPQNNPYGAFLTAQGDLYARIGAKQNVIRADLQLGQGFMSWKSCKDMPGSTIDPNDPDQVEAANEIIGNDMSGRVRNNKDGTQTYQTCETQTPGSVISGTLQKSLNVPATELELADDINAIVNALITQMITKMLSSGLHALSGSSGGGQSYTQLIVTDINSNREAEAMAGGLQENISSAITEIDKQISLFDPVINAVKDSENRYALARNCYTKKLNDQTVWQKNVDFIMAQIALINNKISSDVATVLNSLTAKKASVVANRQKLVAMSDALAGSGSATTIRDQSQKYTDFIQSGALNSQPNIDDAKTQVSIFNNDASDMLKQCD